VITGRPTLHNGELHNSYPPRKYYSDDEIKIYEMGGACNQHRTDNKCIKISVSDIYQEETTNKVRHKWWDNIKSDSKEIACELRTESMAEHRVQW
jgi:hypothetical protein